MDIGRPLPEDVTRDLLDELIEFKSLYETLSKSVVDGVAELDYARRIVRFNAGAEALTGYSSLSVLGRSFEEIVQRSDGLFDGDILQRQPRSVEFTIRDSNDRAVGVRGRVAALQTERKLDGYIVTFSPLRTTEIEQLKNELVSTVSHELKTPLAAIKAYTATLRANPEIYAGERDEYLTVIEGQADRLARLVDDMLLVSRVEAGQMLRRRDRVSLDWLLDRVLRPGLTNKHAISRETEGVTISGDPERLQDVFRNLIENAVKYSPDGGTIVVSARESAESTIVEVRDEGIGIAEEHLPYIFDRFYRVDSDVATEAGGSGLGLFIVHALVRAHGGNVGVRSDLGAGTTFTVTIPARVR